MLLPFGLKTDLLVRPHNLFVRRHSEDLGVMRNPDRDDHWFGNMLLLPEVPAPADLPRLLDAWRQAFADAPGVAKTVLQWEATPARCARLAPAVETAAHTQNLILEHNVVLRLERRPSEPLAARAPVTVRPVLADADWSAVLAVANGDAETPGRREFNAWRQAEYRRLIDDTGRGQWWLVELNGEVVASAGIFWDESGRLARFQRVDTRADARGLGCCSALISTMVIDTARRLPELEECVIVAELGSQAERVYRRVGFEPYVHQDSIWGDRV